MQECLNLGKRLQESIGGDPFQNADKSSMVSARELLTMDVDRTETSLSLHLFLVASRKGWVAHTRYLQASGFWQNSLKHRHINNLKYHALRYGLLELVTSKERSDLGILPSIAICWRSFSETRINTLCHDLVSKETLLPTYWTRRDLSLKVVSWHL